MLKNKIEKIQKFAEEVKTDVNFEIISNFLEWFHTKLEIHFKQKNNYNMIPKKGEILLINFGFNIGSEVNKIRPGVVISNNFLNGSHSIIILPIKTYKKKICKNYQIFIKKDSLNKLDNDSIINLTSIRETSKKRIIRKIGILDDNYISSIDRKLLKVLNIKNQIK